MLRIGLTFLLMQRFLLLFALTLIFTSNITAQITAPPANTWVVTGSLNTARYGATATLLTNGLVLVAGGNDGSGAPLASAELYNPATGIWTLTGSLNVARYGATATLLANGQVLVAGGTGPIASAELYNPATGTWTLTGSLNTARWGATATLLPNGQVLVAGGYAYGVGYLSSAELYNPAAGTWTPTGALNNTRWWATATLLTNGQVLVAGGYNGNNLSTAELYDPAAGTWTLTGALNDARTDATATLLPNGEVLVTGGSIFYSSNFLSSAELYNPATGTWTRTGSLNNARGEATATLLNNGQVLVAGGKGGDNVLATVELYNPATGTWTLTSSLNNARYEAAATLLPNGEVLVAGGENSSGAALASAELLTVASPPALSITAQSGSINVPVGQPINLFVTAGGTAPFNYTWLFQSSVISGATGPTLTINNAQAANEGIYYAVVANSVGSVTSAVISVRITPSAPVIINNPASLTLPASSNATFSVVATGSRPLGYQWLFKKTPIAGATAPQYSLSNVQSGNSGAYQVIVSNSLGTVTSTAATLTVTPLAPYFTIQPVSGQAAAGSNYTFTGLANGSQPISYRWQHNGTNLPGATLASLTLKNLVTGESGAYTLLASNTVATSLSTAAQLTVYAKPALLLLLTNQVVDVSNTVVLAVHATGSPTPTYSWEWNNIPISGSGPTLIITNILRSQTGYYSVTVTNQFGGASSMARVSVFGPTSPIVAWGDNSEGQTTVPTNLDDIVAIAGGDYHSVALHHNGKLAAWGYNGDGQTTVPTNSLAFVAIAAGANHNLAITKTGTLVAWGLDDDGQIDIPSAASNNVLNVAGGDAHSLALLGSGTVIAWGDDSFGQSSVPSGLIGVSAIAAGREDSLALLINGTVTGWGYNAYGQASPPPGLSNVVAIAAGYLHSAALCSDGTVTVWGDNTYGQTTVPAGLSNVVAIAAGDYDTLALRQNGSVIGWGDDSYGQTSVPAALANATAIAAGNYHGLALAPLVYSLQAQAHSAGLVMQWHGTGVLQWAPTPNGPFTDVTVQGNTYTNNDMSAPAKFFRIRH